MFIDNSNSGTLLAATAVLVPAPYKCLCETSLKTEWNSDDSGVMASVDVACIERNNLKLSLLMQDCV